MKKQTNVNRKPSEAKEYFAGTINLKGTDVRVLFTDHDLNRPIERAKKQPEDFQNGNGGLGMFKLVKTILKTVFVFVAVMLFAGCAGTTTTIKEFDADGKVIKETVTEQDVVNSITQSTKDKTILVWSDGWKAKIKGSGATPENPTPTFELEAGKTNDGILLMHKDQKNADQIPKIIQATKSDLSVDATGKINNTSTPTATGGEEPKIPAANK